MRLSASTLLHVSSVLLAGVSAQSVTTSPETIQAKITSGEPYEVSLTFNPSATPTFNPPASQTLVHIPPVPSSPSLIGQWVDQLFATFSTTVDATLGIRFFSELVPHWSCEWLASWVAQGASLSPASYNIPFDPVEGVNSSQVRWFVECENRTKDDPVILYLHGGGYTLRLTPPYATNLWNLYHELDNSRLSILWLDYTSSLQEPYPTQLREAAAVYNQLAKTSNNIIVEGDSAGGHLALNMVRTIAYPVDSVQSLSSVPSAMVLLSPAVTFGINPFNGTMWEYQGRDYIDASALNQWGGILSDGDLVQQYSVFYNQWKDYINWKSVLPEPSRVMTTYGEIEVLRGPIETFLDIAFGGHTSATSGTVVEMEPNGQHDGIVKGTSDGLWQPYVDFHRNLFV